MTRAALLKRAADIGLDTERFAHELDDRIHAQRVNRFASACLSGATPGCFINGRRGPCNDESAIERPLGLRQRQVALASGRRAPMAQASGERAA